jgi:putative membrane protein insertion efficiency factor
MTNLEITSHKHSSAVANVAKQAIPTQALLAAVKSYQKLTTNRIAPCRFYPSCSQYSYEALELHGFWRGIALSVKRISRCRPLGPHGVDLVPEVKKARSAQ